MSKTGLNDNHLRRLSSAMASLDAAGARLLDVAESKHDPASLTLLEGFLSAAEREKITTGVRQLRASFREFTKKIGLRPPSRNLRRVLVAEISRMWVILEDLHASGLRGMGPIPASVAQNIDAEVNRMLLIVEQLRESIVKQHAKE